MSFLPMLSLGILRSSTGGLRRHERNYSDILSCPSIAVTAVTTPVLRAWLVLLLFTMTLMTFASTMYRDPFPQLKLGMSKNKEKLVRQIAPLMPKSLQPELACCQRT